MAPFPVCIVQVRHRRMWWGPVGVESGEHTGMLLSEIDSLARRSFPLPLMSYA